MSKFKKFLYLAEMSYSDALKVFGLDSVKDKDELKKLYRRLSLKNHPDQGGSEDKMKDITVAYDILAKGKESESGGSGKFDWEASNAKYKMAGAQIKTALLSNFQPDVFLQFFQELSGLKFNYEIIRTMPRENDRSPSSAGFDVEFFTKDRSSVFTFKVHAQLHDIVWPKAELGIGDLSYTVYTEAHGFHLNKKQKMSKSDWKFTRDHSFFRKPEQLFPKKKMKDIFSGKTSNRQFKKRDMETFLSKKLGAKLGYGGGQTHVSIPLGEDYTMELWRTTFFKKGSWSFDGVYLKHKRLSSGHFAFGLPEEEETAKTFEKVTNEARKVKGDAKIKKTEDLLKFAYEAWKKSKGI
jgi:curved DNA-binding protein CbpA